MAPVFYPTTAEFKDPMQYIQRVSLEAQQFGICKIVPPDTYRPASQLSMSSKFQFSTRKQQVNMMEGTTRQKMDYLQSVERY